MLEKSCTVGNRVAANRFLAQPLEHNAANPNGGFSDYLLEKYRKIAAGKWGIVVLETTATSYSQKCRINALVMGENQENERSWIDFFKEMRSIDETPLWIVELSAAGDKNVSGPRKAVFEGQREFPRGDVLTTGEVDALIDEYVRATRLALERGADGVDFKLCHSYLAGVFLRPNNRRPDLYGGSFENRTRFLVEYTRRARKEIGDKDFIWATRLNAWDGPHAGVFGMAGPKDDAGAGWTRSDKEYDMLLDLLASLGYDFINVSGGFPVHRGVFNPATGLSPGFYMFQDAARHAKARLQETAPGIRVGSAAWSGLGPWAIPVAEEHLKEGMTDFIGFGRWQLCEPRLPRLVLEEAARAGMDPVRYLEEESNVCIACSQCGKGLAGEGPVTCNVYE